MGRVEGKIAIVTGSASSFGGACVTLLGREGATVVSADASGDGPSSSTVDLASEAGWERLIAETLARHGRVDILVQAQQLFLRKALSETTAADLRAVMDANTVTAWLGLKHGIAALRRSGGGFIVNVSSVLGRVAHAETEAFCAAAGGIRIMTKSAALECAGRGDNILINSVHAGAIEGLAIAPAEIAATVLHFCTPDARYTTGLDVAVDGGYSLA